MRLLHGSRHNWLVVVAVVVLAMSWLPGYAAGFGTSSGADDPDKIWLASPPPEGEVALNWTVSSLPHPITTVTDTLIRWTAAGQTIRSVYPEGYYIGDSVPAGVPGACYQLRLDSPQLPGPYTSDILCTTIGARSGAGPESVAITLFRSSATAVLGWKPVSGALGYLVLTLGTTRFQWTAGTQVTDQTGGARTCYVVVAVLPPTSGGPPITGASEILCALPHTGTGP